MSSEFDVIVVGAGPAGSASALVLARKGVKTLVLEQAKVPGENSAIGGVLYGDEGKYGITSLLPNFETEAPLERRIVSHELVVLGRPDTETGATRHSRFTENSLISKLGLLPFGFETEHDFTLLRRPFDRWLAGEAVKAGATLSAGTKVEGLLIDGGSVAGIRTAGEKISSKLVIDASGVNSTLVREAGLRPSLIPRGLYHAIEREFRLDGDTIEKRFKTRPGEGRATSYIGEFTHGVRGWAFIQTNRDSLTVGLGVSLDSLIRGSTERFDHVGKMLDLEREFLANPVVAEALDGSEPFGFSAHNMPRGPQCLLKRPYADGFIAAGDALGALVKLGPMIDGMRQAIASGVMAASAYLAARESGSFRSRNLSRYRDFLAPIYADVNRSGRESFISESAFVYDYLPRIVSGSGLFSSTFRPRTTMPDAGKNPSPLGISTGARPRADGDNPGYLPEVNDELASRSVTKPWVSSCPADCFTIITQKGSFVSFKELYELNLGQLAGGGRAEGSLARKAFNLTQDDIAKARVKFDRAACVGCGTCGAIGPPEIVSSRRRKDGNEQEPVDD